jgi:hypothetical protein
MPETGVLAVFKTPAEAAEGVRAARQAGATDVRASMPAPYPEVVEALGKPRSALGRVTFFAAMAGVTAGFAMTIGLSAAWPIVTGGKGITTPTPFVFVSFEVCVLVGALSTLAALLVSTIRARKLGPPIDDPRFSADRVGIYVGGGDLGANESILRGAGAEEVRRVP